MPETLPTPIFIISFNRGPMLMRVVASYRGLARPVDIIVHDNGSTDPDTKDCLAALEAEGAIVHRGPPIAKVRELNNVDASVQDYFQESAQPRRYVVTDCDIDMSIADPKALDVYDAFLDAFPDAACVGPMLRIADIPASYPLYNRVMNRHIEQFWQHAPQWFETPYGRAAYIPAPIDTTFALHRAGQPFQRLRRGIRVYEPYEALHLDWYISETGDSYFRTSNKNLSHWNNAGDYEKHARVKLEWESFLTVERAAGGELRVVRQNPKVAVVAAAPPKKRGWGALSRLNPWS